ncbi:MAG: hypothetical protein AAFR16_11850, partial [Pseudomonadota bacterium]
MLNLATLARKAGEGAEACRRRLVPGNLGDASETALRQLAECVQRQLARLAEQMAALKSAQRLALLDTVQFSEKARLIATARDPSQEAIAPMAALIDRYDAMLWEMFNQSIIDPRMKTC